MRPVTATLIAVALAGGIAPGLRAQRLSVGLSRWLTSPHLSDYRLSVSRHEAGPLALSPFAQVAVHGTRPDGSLLAGLGADLTVRLGASARPYLIGGLSGGFLDLRSAVVARLWGAWSVGVGAELLRTRLAALGVEARYQSLSLGRVQGVSVGLRLGGSLGRRRSEPPGSGEPTVDDADPPWRGAPAATAQVAETAVGAMGTPYRWGGTDANGFDCSGLIQYAYGEVGILLPRRSADQARAGRAVQLDPDQLLPGDILVFTADAGGDAGHVGLYLGRGQFIHSASAGVRISRLSRSDPDGEWWLRRWVGARRIVEAEPR